MIGDTQATSNWEFWRECNTEKTRFLIKEIARRKPAFVINLGDLTTRGQSTKHWLNFDIWHKPIHEAGIPYLPVLGNHDYYGKNKRAFNNLFSRFPFLQSRRWYSFIFNRIGFIVLDSNFSVLQPEEIEAEINWYNCKLEELEESNNVDYIIVCCHHPPFTNSKVIKPSKSVAKNFVRPFINYSKTTVFFSGHCHSYEKFIEKGKYFIVSGGGGGPRHKLKINPQKQRFKDYFRGESLRFLHFCEVEITENCLLLKIIKLDNDGTFTCIDEVKLLKKNILHSPE
ncbi:MAG: metallophosphoesterase [Candidatus Sumerlaeia bacterium]|nr:metallophosphoesterase [Candidatus Sumerlaeia bacterium]